LQEKLAIITEVRVGLIIAPSAAVAHTSPETANKEVFK